MKDDPLQQEVLRDLRTLRRAPRPFGLAEIAALPRFVEIVGNGSAEQAHSTILDVYDQQLNLGENDIVTYFSTCGFNTPGPTLDLRLRNLSATRFVDTRTVLRHSNAGAVKLSAILRDMSNLYRPLGRINLIQIQNSVACQILIRLPKHSKYREPHVYVNDESKRVPNLTWNIAEDASDSEWMVAVETTPPLPLRVTNETDRHTPVFSITVYWLMPVWASWVAAMELSDSRLTTVLSITRNYRAELALFFDGERPTRSPGLP